MATLNDVFDLAKTLSETDRARLKDLISNTISKDSSLNHFITENRFASGVFCPHCKNTHIKRNGHKRSIHRYMCLSCRKTFNIATNTIVSGTTKDLSVWDKYIDCMMNGLSISKVSNLGKVSEKNLHNVFDQRILRNTILCTDGLNSYANFAAKNHIELIQLRSGKSKKGIYHIQHINAYHSMLKAFIRKFKGVSTKYLNNCILEFYF